MGRPSKYPAEFRAEAVKLVRTSDRSRGEIASECGVAPTSPAGPAGPARDRDFDLGFNPRSSLTTAVGHTNGPLSVMEIANVPCRCCGHSPTRVIRKSCQYV